MDHCRSIARTGPFNAPVFSRIFIIITGLAWAGLLTAGQQDSGQHRPTGDLVISGSEWVTDAPTRLVAAAGYFEDSGRPQIRVELADSGKQSLARLMAGEADFALTAAVPLAETLVSLHDQDVPPQFWPVVLASIGLSSRTHHVIADGARGIEQPADLAGHAVGLLLGTSAHFGWDHFAALHDIESDSLVLVDTRPGDLADGLAAGRFDAVVAWTPFSERIMDQLGANARSFPMQAMDSVSWLLVSRRALIDQHPQAVQRILRGYADAIELLRKDVPRAIELLETSPDELRGSRVEWRLALGWPVIANIEAKLKWNADRLGIESMRVSPRLYIERAPMERFWPRAVTLPVWIAEADGQR